MQNSLKVEGSNISEYRNMFQYRTWLAKFMNVFGYVMVIVYIIMGSLLLLPQVYPAVHGNLKWAFAAFFITYGLFRLARKLFAKKDINNE